MKETDQRVVSTAQGCRTANSTSGEVKALADDRASVLFQAAGGHILDCTALLLKNGGSDNV
ncbi:hypothetical protein Nmel_005137, partial [Mimus melanotis]